MKPPSIDDIEVGRVDKADESVLEAAATSWDEEVEDAEHESRDWSADNIAAEERYQDRADRDVEAIQAGITDGKVISTTISNFVEAGLMVDKSRKFDLVENAFMKGMFDLVAQYPKGCRNQLWATSRQVGKSSSQAAKLCALGAMIPAFKALHVSPRFSQVRVFSSQRFQTMCETSPGMTPWINPARHLWQVSDREFMNGSTFNFRSCYLNADAIRGITSQMLCIDEIQDIVSDAIPVIEQCQARFNYRPTSPLSAQRFNCYAGTHKTTSNVLNTRWNSSSQFEWLVKCEKCGHWNYLDEEVIAEDAYRCTKAKCREIIDMRNGRWVPAKPDFLDTCWGFRISQLMVPFRTHGDIVAERDAPNYTRQKFYNEVLGLPFDEGELLLTPRVMSEACNNKPMSTISEIRKIASSTKNVVAGVDWGQGTSSYTVLTIGRKHLRGAFEVLYMKKFKGEEAELNTQVKMINQICRDAGVRWLGSDYGFGAPNNARLVGEMGWNRYGAHDLLLEFLYSATSAQEARWDGRGERYTINRSKSMGYLIDGIRTQQVEFFREEDMKEFIPDFTAIFLEYNERNNTIRYDHSTPDDAFHSVNYAIMADRQMRGELVPSGLPELPRDYY